PIPRNLFHERLNRCNLRGKRILQKLLLNRAISFGGFLRRLVEVVQVALSVLSVVDFLRGDGWSTYGFSCDRVDAGCEGESLPQLLDYGIFFVDARNGSFRGVVDTLFAFDERGARRSCARRGSSAYRRWSWLCSGGWCGGFWHLWCRYLRLRISRKEIVEGRFVETRGSVI